MAFPRLVALSLFAVLGFGQSVRSTHSGLLYFFDGYVFIGEEKQQQKFGRFPEIGEGSVLRTELGHAEVLLTPGVILRIGENSAIRMVSASLTDTRVELLRGSAIMEVTKEAKDPPDTLIYKNWKLRLPQEGVARIDTDPQQVRAYSGTAEVSAEGTKDVAKVERGEVLPLASVLLSEPAATPAADDFNVWAMNRSSLVSEDNSIAAGITDDPDQIDNNGAVVGGGYSYFPPTGIPSLGISTPYGLSYWSPYQMSYYNGYVGGYPYGLPYSPYQAWPVGGLAYPRAPRIPLGTGFVNRPTGTMLPRPTYIAPPRPAPAMAAPHAAPHPMIRR